MDGSKIESLLCSASVKCLRGANETADLTKFCVPGMKTDEETRDFLGRVALVWVSLQAAEGELKEIMDMYAEARHMGSVGSER